MVRSSSVIAVGIDIGARLPQLFSGLETQGLHVVEAAPESLLPALEKHAPATIVVYNGPREDTARRVLTSVARWKRRIPVIVIVDRSDFSEYFDLMSQGAFDYFDLTGDPRWIERALQSAIEDQIAA